MKYFYNCARLPDDSYLLSQIDSAADRLYKKLVQLDLNQLNISEYNRRYLLKKLTKFAGSLQHYTHILALALADNAVPLSRFAFVDYGGGSGVLSLLAKESGIGRVIYNDIYEISCADVKEIARATQININDYVTGDICELVAYIEKNACPVDAIASFDVIEHIYDVDGYLRKLHLLSNRSFRVVFSSGANARNPLLSHNFKKLHLKYEYEDRKYKYGDKMRDTLHSFLNLRKEIITGYAPELTSEVVTNIARITRGLIKADIEKYVNEYRQNGSISYHPNHPTNTCDPYTGNWQEQFLETERLEKILEEEGFEVKTLSGYYLSSTNFFMKYLRDILNLTIRTLGRKALHFSPRYIIYAIYKSD